MRLWPRAVYEWGSTAAERAEPFGCDDVLAAPDDVLYRALDVHAPCATVFRWLCQLRVAPYSYDKLDNLGRVSPRTLTPGLERLEVGQRMMTVFRLTAFEQDRSITVLSEGRVFGRVACTYRVQEREPGRSRLVVKMRVDYRSAFLRGLPLRPLLPAGDLVMMRRQLLNLKQLAEGSALARPVA